MTAVVMRVLLLPPASRLSSFMIAGKNTTVLRDVKVDPKLCFSIRCTSRTLDLQAKSEQQRDAWVKGLSQIHAKLTKKAAAAAPFRTAAAPATETGAPAAGGPPSPTNEQKA